MELVTGVMGSLLPKLGELLKDEYDLQRGTRKKIKSLSRELESVHAVLRKVAAVPLDQLDELVKLWARDVRELSYDMEDIVDMFLVRFNDDHESDDPWVLRRLRKKMSKLFKKAKDRREIAGAIQSPVSIDPRLQALYKRSTELTGVDGPMDKIINMLSPRDDIHLSDKKKIISIVGFGGLGKTTLAKAVYDKLKPDFDCGAFVPNPDMKKVLRDILIDLDKQKYKHSIIMKLNERQLIDEIKDLVEKKRCALQDSNYGSRVVVTTRISEVATHVGCYVYKMEPLSHDDSEKLLYATIANAEGKCLARPSAVACEKILNKCDGVPLSIITIARLLANKPEEDWSEVYNSIGFGHGGNSVVENTRTILSFSYYDLPSHLKACFLYLNIFSEDVVIEKNLLIWKWIAEGFVHDEEAAGVGLFELGEGQWRQYQGHQSKARYGEGYVYGCRVHDMMLDLICSLSKEENFVTLVDSHEQVELPPSNARRLALQSINIKEQNRIQLANMGMEQVRSFLANRCAGISLESSHFRVLRVLALEYCKDNVIFWHFRGLYHLRYLGLVNAGITELPKEVGDLIFLQTLDLRETFILELPESVGLLTQLLCLYVDHGTRIPADLIGNLTSLQELCIRPADNNNFNDMRQFVKALGRLRELRVLQTQIDVLDDSMEKDLLESIENLHKIRYLEILGTSWGMNITWTRIGFISTRHLKRLCLECIEFSRLPFFKRKC
uniref:Rx N-terminal domain-containing protein n=1 Tax=Oryza glumipatula TaxID=40148 RepID=A0A0E0ARD2_9ORYZ